jgi:dihydrofolate reductase
MAKLSYSAIMSLDGCVADEDGSFDWAVPDEEVHAFVNDLERPVGTYLYGRRMYEVMVGWETAGTRADQRTVARDLAETNAVSATASLPSSTAPGRERTGSPGAHHRTTAGESAPARKRRGRPRPSARAVQTAPSRP